MIIIYFDRNAMSVKPMNVKDVIFACKIYGKIHVCNRQTLGTLPQIIHQPLITRFHGDFIDICDD